MNLTKDILGRFSLSFIFCLIPSVFYYLNRYLLIKALSIDDLVSGQSKTAQFKQKLSYSIYFLKTVLYLVCGKGLIIKIRFD